MRRVWFLAPGGLPFTASLRSAPAGAAWWCQEGDEAWRPVDTAPQSGARPARPAPAGQARPLIPAQTQDT